MGLSITMLRIQTIVVSPFAQNCRILTCDKQGLAVVVDPGGDAALILDALGRSSARLQAIWLTHSHLDHCGAVAELKSEFDVPLLAHPIEKELRANVERICEMYGVPPGLMQNCPEPDTEIVGGERLQLGEEEFELLFTPGHSPGHICFYNRKASKLIAGDTLFAGSIGRTDLPGGDHRTLIRSIKEQILTLPGETAVLSGHGPDTKISAEISSNPFLS